MFDAPKPGNVEDIFAGTADSHVGAPLSSPSGVPPPVRPRVSDSGAPADAFLASSDLQGAPVASPFTETPVPPNASLNAMPATPPSPAPMLEAGTDAGKRLILVLAVILLVALAGGAAYWYFQVSKVGRPVSPQEVPTEANQPEPAAPAPQEPQGSVPSVTPEPLPPEAVPEPTPEPASPQPGGGGPVPTPSDADHDGLSDVEEAAFGTDINSVDTDFDGLFDYEEVKVYLTSPTNADSDGDGYSDGVEIKNGFNPLGPGRLQNVPGQ